MLRSILFQAVFYVSLIVQMIFWLPVFFFLPRKTGWKVVKLWGKSCLWLQHAIIGSRYEFRGMDNIPADGRFILAAKHQSTWETYTVLPFLADPSYVLKRELMFIPLFGWFAAKQQVVPVHRGRGGIALASMSASAAKQFRDNRQIIIYPEGTRRAAGAPPAYKYGVTHLYQSIGAPVLPMALNSGLYWPRNSLRLYPGTIVLEFLPVIEPGLSKEEFAPLLEKRIEEACDALIAEAAASANPPPLAKRIMARAG